MKYSPEELKELLAAAPTDAKGRPIISDEDFIDNMKELPSGTKSESGKVASNGGFIDPGKKGDPKTISNCSKAGKAAQAANAERRKIAETIDIFLKSVDKETGKTMQEKIVEAMGLKAMDGCVGAFEALRDTVGEKPTDQVSLDVMTDKDREVLKNLTERLGLNDKS